MPVPPQYNSLMPYLIIPRANEFIGFTKRVFNATEQMIVPREQDVIMHGEMRIGDAVIMFADMTEQLGARPAGMFIYVNSVDETYKNALEAGASSMMEPQTQPYGYTCGFTDPFGNSWWPVEVK